MAAGVLATHRDVREGLRRDPRVPLDALATVVDLRARHGGFDPGVDVGALRAGGLGLVDARHCATVAAPG